MRILMATATFPPQMPGGGQVSAVMIANMLKKAGHDLRIVQVCDDDEIVDVKGIEVRRIKCPNIYWDYFKPHPAWQKMLWHLQENGNPGTFFAMRREIEAWAPDIVLTVSIENTNVATWAAAQSMGLPVAHTAFNSFLLCWNGVMLKKGKSCAGQCASCKVTSIGKRFLSRYVDALIGESEDVISRHTDEGYFPNAATRRIPAAIEQLNTSKPRSFPTDRPLRFGFLGVHTEFKGLGSLAEAARMIPEDVPAEFVIGGTGKDEFAERVPDLFPKDRTEFLGWTTPEELFSKADVLVFPSLGREAFGRSSIEAFSYAVPVLSTSIGGVAENIQAGVNGYHFNPGNAEEIRDLIVKIAQDPGLYEQLSKGALKSADLYLKDNVGSAFCSFLNETIERHQSKAEPTAGQYETAS